MFGLQEKLLYMLIKVSRSPVREGKREIAGEIGTDEAGMSYAKFQFERKVRYGLSMSVLDKDVLEVGTGHGGIATFMALNGATSVVAIDLNERNLEYARRFAQKMFDKVAARNSTVNFLFMNAEKMDFASESFDVIVCDNLIEHLTSADAVMKEMHRVLRKGGKILIPNFPSIYSKYGPHVKYGVGIPWVNIFFSEKTIVRVMHRIAKSNSKMYDIYPGLKDGGMTFRDIRKYKDLAYITYGAFLRNVEKHNFKVSRFVIEKTLFGKVAARLPFFRSSLLSDVFSIGASAILEKK